MAAVIGDVELAEMQADGKPPAGAPVVPMTEFTPESERLSVVIDRLGELLALEIAKATRSKRPKRVKPYPRPETARQRVTRRRQYENFLYLRKRMLGDRVK